MARPAKLTDRDMKVIDNYFTNGWKKAKALKDAGFVSGKSYVHAFYKKPLVVQEIQRRRDSEADKYEVTRERLIQEYAKLAYNSLGDLVEIAEDGTGWIDLRKLTPGRRAALAEFSTDEYKEERGEGGAVVKKMRVKFHDKKGALDSLARIMGLFQEKVQVTGELSLVERIQQGRKRAFAESK